MVLHVFADNPVQPTGVNIHHDSELLNDCMYIAST